MNIFQKAKLDCYCTKNVPQIPHLFLRMSNSPTQVAVMYDTIWKKLDSEVLHEGLHWGPLGFQFIRFPSIFKTLQFEDLTGKKVEQQLRKGYFQNFGCWMVLQLFSRVLRDSISHSLVGLLVGPSVGWSVRPSRNSFKGFSKCLNVCEW